MPFVYEALLQSIIGGLDSNVDSIYSLKRDLGGSAVFLKSKSLQFLYVLFTPFIPIGTRAYESDPLVWMSVVSGVSNLALLYYFFRSIMNSERHMSGPDGFGWYFCCVILFYVEFAVVTAIGVSTGLYGMIEPRYKIAIWSLEFIFILAYRQGARKNSNIHGRRRFVTAH
jgi:hypothetical protein